MKDRKRKADSDDDDGAGSESGSEGARKKRRSSPVVDISSDEASVAEEEDEDESDDVPSCVPPEGTLWLERTKQTREGDGNDEVAKMRRQRIYSAQSHLEHSQEPARCRREGHTNVTYV